jgi:hypothetical protein
MLWVFNSIDHFKTFKLQFQSSNPETPFLDLSTFPLGKLADLCDDIVEHHSKCVIFLGYLEAGWMLDMSHQTRIRKLIRKFPVGLVTYYVESIPFSWKNEIEIFFEGNPVDQNGRSDTFNNGCSLQDKSNV